MSEIENNEQEILATIDAFGIHIASSRISDSLEKKKISASMITGLEGCPARWLAQSFITRELVPEEQDNAARRGSLFHKIMEDVFRHPPIERTKSLVRKTVNDVLKSEEFSDLNGNEEVFSWVKLAINGYYQMGGNPQKVEVAKLAIGGRKESDALEVFVNGKIGDTKRSVLGFVDRVVLDTKKKDGSVIIEDWKSSSKAKRWNPKNKSEDGLPEARQQTIYSMLLEDDVDVSGARLIYPVAKEIVDVDIYNQKLRDRVVKDVEETDKKLDSLIDSNNFEFKPDFLCAWCPLAKICPSAQIKPYAKMKEAYATQPDAEILSKGIEFK